MNRLLLLGAALLLLLGANLYFGAVDIPMRAVSRVLLGSEVERASWRYIIWGSMNKARTGWSNGAGHQRRMS